MSAAQRNGPDFVSALAVAVGAWLRLDQIAGQVVANDEWHALNTLVRQDYRWIFTHFGISDFSIPLTLYDKLLGDTVGLTEIGVRAPMLVAGIASLVVLPLLLRIYIGRSASAAFAWLLAISPLHIYFSRYARPYALSLLLAFVGVIALERWIATGRPKWAVACVASSVLAPWLHPIFLPFTLASFVWFGATRWLARRRPEMADEVTRGPGSLWPVALGTAVGLAVLIGPPLWVDLTSLRAHSGGPSGDFAPWMKSFELLSGTSGTLLGLGVWLTLFLGVIALRRKCARFAGYLAFLIACQVAAVLVSGPAGLGIPIVTVRYTLCALVAVLALAAAGMEHLDETLRMKWRAIPPHVSTAVIGVSLLAFSPLRAIYYHPNNWTNDDAFQSDYSRFYSHEYAKRWVKLQEVPPFYLRVARDSSADECIVEAPWNYEWNHLPYPFFQRIHHRQTIIGFVGRPGARVPLGELPWPDARFRFRGFVHVSDLAAMRARGVRYLLLHRDPTYVIEDGMHPGLADVEYWIRDLKARVGTPAYEDDGMCVFDLKQPE